MPAIIDEVVADIQPSRTEEPSELSGDGQKPSPQMEIRRLESFLARSERRRQRVRAD